MGGLPKRIDRKQRIGWSSLTTTTTTRKTANSQVEPSGQRREVVPDFSAWLWHDADRNAELSTTGDELPPAVATTTVDGVSQSIGGPFAVQGPLAAVLKRRFGIYAARSADSTFSTGSRRVAADS